MAPFPSVLGLELQTAIDIAEKAGYTVGLSQTESLRGVPGADSRRVVRQALNEQDKTVIFTWSWFKTTAE